MDKVFIKKDLARIQITTRHVLVKGDPAGGKTTFAKQLVTWIMRNEDSSWLVPVIVRTIDLVRCKSSFTDDKDVIDQYLQLHYTDEVLYRFFCQARAEGRLLVILDGYDEADTMEYTLASHIEDVLVNECFLVVTSEESPEEY